MHDLRALRADPDGFDADLKRRGEPAVAQAVLLLDHDRRAAETALQELQARRNQISREIGAMRRSGADTSALEAEVTGAKAHMEALQARVDDLDGQIRGTLERLPNRLDESVPAGADESGNVQVHQHGTPPEFAFAAREHFELGEALGLMDFETASRLSGARFVVLRGQLARMERALGQFMLDLHTGENGYEETAVPVLVNNEAMYGTDKLPKFADQSFRTEDGRWLIPTAEVPLTASVAGQILPVGVLPQRLVALSSCFRSEAGAAGRDTRGMLRQHQFQKVEMVSITTPEESDAEHERMTRCAEMVLEKLGIPYRRMLLCAGDTGFGAARTFDLEAWLPGQKAWREISSCSTTRDFQARRLNARYRAADGKPAFVHTLNGSGLAVGRTLIAVMENYQTADGSITVPDVLRPYMGGIEVIRSA
ncbi:Seryl-tRNA synthetase [Gluconacetobacter sp. SXCC-1]|uniref:Serine--tRNA ligase n=1 Tax=Komagataeibacter rhaeticus TaxID=215221 RepID=A0A181C828_9PROT|nr:serine--tRNA ligase [Komagataeibacter rhaeticus]ATU73529.1 serine--tRNA ligase [Komagataeibacter xylinus]EGG75850.1 Seryl-tRNA synthetase [Gluconacetobacter sp. SXCC-1]QIP34639.1 serine--tRNA ligase [Komagataeibacter rhaeticus]QOC47161.1 serine--tRNA ligase [Komagataeibacter rhaeticus]WPP20501.1 serine--tRNA ligase [Komagataeibacter rhaeticus]